MAKTKAFNSTRTDILPGWYWKPGFTMRVLRRWNDSTFLTIMASIRVQKTKMTVTLCV